MTQIATGSVMVHERIVLVQLSFVLYAADDSELFATCRVRSRSCNVFHFKRISDYEGQKKPYNIDIETTGTIHGRGDGGSSKIISQEENVGESERKRSLNKRSAFKLFGELGARAPIPANGA